MVEKTAVLANISTVIGMIVSILAIFLSVNQSRKQYRISQYEKRKELYDFFESFIDDFLFYIDNVKGNENSPKPLTIALNIFAKDFLCKGIKNPDEMLLELTKNYNSNLQSLRDILIYFHFSAKLKTNNVEIQRLIKEYYSLILEFYYVRNGDKDGNVDKIIVQMRDILVKLREVFLDKDTNRILEKMKKELEII